MLEGEIALVTGASRGIGRAIALVLGRAGAAVAGTATTGAGAVRIDETLRANGCAGLGLTLNVTEQASIDAALKRVGDELGAPTIPFRLANYIVRDPNDPSVPKWVASGLPAQGTLLKIGHRNTDVLSILSSVSPGEAIWHLEVSGKTSPKYRPYRIKTIERIEIALDEAGRHVFKDKAGNYVTISVDYDAWRIVECKPGRSLFLRLLALCSTAIPHAASKNMVWDEPMLLIPGGSFGWLSLLLAPYRSTNFDHAKSKCLHVPDSIDRRLNIETSFDGKASDYPAKITSDWELLRGPTRLEADFQSGRISFVLQSFTPRLLVHQD